MEWIKADERLPEVKKRVLLCMGKGSIDIGWLKWHEEKPEKDFTGNLFIRKVTRWSHGHQDKENPFADFEVTHWMPLPQKPME